MVDKKVTAISYWKMANSSFLYKKAYAENLAEIASELSF